jgi:hypothetical protein
MKRIFIALSILPLCLVAFQEDVARVMSIFDGNDYLAGAGTKFNPNAYIDYRAKDMILEKPVKGAGILPVVRDEEGNLHAILAQAIVENGAGKENGKSPVYITPSQDSAFGYQFAVDMASRAEELQILDAQAFNPAKVEAAIYKARLALPGNGLIRGGYGTMSYVAEFDGLNVQTVKGFCHNVQPKLDTIAAIINAQEEKEAYDKLFPTSAQIERSDRIRSFHVVPVSALLGAITQAQAEATAQNSWIQAPVQVEGHGAVASYVARTLALHADKLRLLK